MARTITFQRSLFRNLAGMVALLGILFAATAYYYSERAKQRLAEQLTSRAVFETQAMMSRFLEPVSSEVVLSARYFKDAGVDLDDPLELDRYFQPILTTFEQMSGATIARSDGSSYTLKRTELGWERRLSNPAKHPGRVFLTRWMDDRSEATEGWKEIAYDARTRPWFTGAVELFSPDAAHGLSRHKLYWTRPYHFFEPSDEHGITASLAFPAAGGEMHVTSFDVLLSDISTFTMDVRLEESGSVAVIYSDMVDDSLLLAGLPAGIADTPAEALDKYLLEAPEDVGGALYDYVTAVLADNKDQRVRPRKFTSGERIWWGAAASGGTSQQVWILAMVPEDELLVDFRNLRLIPIVGTLLMVLLALWRSLVLSSLYARPVEALVSQSERMAGLNFERLGTSGTRIEELRMLAEAQEQMRRSFEAISSRREDLPIARTLRASPKDIPAEAPAGYQLGLVDRPMEAVGGGVFDAVPSGDGELSLLVAVVPGEGVAAAQGGGCLRSAFEAAVGLGVPLEANVAQIRELARRAQLNAPVALCVAQLDVAGRWLSVLTELACPVVHFSAASGEARWLEAQERPEPIRLGLEPGDVVLLLTESVVNALSSQRERFGTKRLEEVLREHAGEDAEAVASRIDSALDEYTGGSPPERDRVLLVLRRRI